MLLLSFCLSSPCSLLFLVFVFVGGGCSGTGLKRPDFYTRVVDQGERPELDPAWPEPVRNLLESCWRTNLDERLSFREVAGILKVRSPYHTLVMVVKCCSQERNSNTFRVYFLFSPVFPFVLPRLSHLFICLLMSKATLPFLHRCSGGHLSY